MLFGTPTLPLETPYRPDTIALFDSYPIGTCLRIGTGSGSWVGRFGGLQNCAAVLTNAQLLSNEGSPIDGLRPIVRIPIRNITFVSQ